MVTMERLALWKALRAANQDQFLQLRPVIMCGGLTCGHLVSPHGRTMNDDDDDDVMERQ